MKKSGKTEWLVTPALEAPLGPWNKLHSTEYQTRVLCKFVNLAEFQADIYKGVEAAERSFFTPIHLLSASNHFFQSVFKITRLAGNDVRFSRGKQR